MTIFALVAAVMASAAHGQSSGSAADKAAARLLAATKQFANFAAVCDPMMPKAFQRTVAILEDKLGPLWTDDVRKLVLSQPNASDVKAQIAEFKGGVASGRYEVVDIRGACEDRLEIAAAELGFAIDAVNFIAQ